MKKLNVKVAVAVGATALAACSTQDFSDSYGGGSESDRKNEYTQKWVERFGLFDTEHDWSTLTGVNAEISPEFGADAVTHIYNADPQAGGHLIGFSRQPGRLELSLPKGTRSVYAVVTDAEGGTLAKGEFDVADGRVDIAASLARETGQSRSVHTPSYFDAMVVCEDLGGIGDYDFNDIVLGLRHVSGTNTLKVMPMAAGGTLEADVYYDGTKIGEIHDLIEPGCDASTMLNTRTFSKIGQMQNIPVTDFSLTDGWKKISLKVKDADETVEISAPDREGQAPQMFCLGGDWYWPTEKTPIDDAFSGFASWTADASNSTWADAYDDSKVVKWDVSQVVTNWFAGTTSDGKTYRAKINNSTNIDVKSDEIYALDPPTSLEGMFNSASTLTSLDVDADHFDTSLANNMHMTFSGCKGLTHLNLSNWDTGNVTTMSNMFWLCSSLTDLNLAGMNTAKLANTDLMFCTCSNLQNLNLSGWDIGSISTADRMFEDCGKLETVTMNNWINKKSNPIIHDIVYSMPAVKTIEMRDCDFSESTNLGSLFRGCSSLTSIDVTGWKIPDLTTLQDAFTYCGNLASVTGLETWDVSKVQNMADMFSLSGVTSLDINGWNTASVTNMNSMFQNCEALTTLSLAGWNTTNVTNVTYMFDGCSKLQSLDLSGWDVSNIKSYEKVFDECAKLETVTMNNLKNSTSNPSLQRILNTMPAVKTLVMHDCDFSKSTDLGYNWTSYGVYEYHNGIFQSLSSLTSLDVTGWKIPDLTTLHANFTSCKKLETITGLNTWDVSKVRNMAEMFNGCSSLTKFDISNWNTGNVTTMNRMFQNCEALTTLSLAGLNTANVTDVSYMFGGCSKLQSLDLSGWDVGSINTAEKIFDGCTELKTLTMNRVKNSKSGAGLERMMWYLPAAETIVMRDCDFTGSTDIGYNYTSYGVYEYHDGVFINRSTLKTIDVTGWKTGTLTTIDDIFEGCSALTSITGLDTWDVSNVTHMVEAFKGCSSLQTLDISTWDMSKVPYYQNMFSGCPAGMTIKCTQVTKDDLVKNTTYAGLPDDVQWVIVP